MQCALTTTLTQRKKILLDQDIFTKLQNHISHNPHLDLNQLADALLQEAMENPQIRNQVLEALRKRHFERTKRKKL